jgi:hypothetical protein
MYVNTSGVESHKIHSGFMEKLLPRVHNMLFRKMYTSESWLLKCGT